MPQRLHTSAAVARRRVRRRRQPSAAAGAGVLDLEPACSALCTCGGLRPHTPKGESNYTPTNVLHVTPCEAQWVVVVSGGAVTGAGTIHDMALGGKSA